MAISWPMWLSRENTKVAFIMEAKFGCIHYGIFMEAKFTYWRDRKHKLGLNLLILKDLKLTSKRLWGKHVAVSPWRRFRLHKTVLRSSPFESPSVALKNVKKYINIVTVDIRKYPKVSLKSSIMKQSMIHTSLFKLFFVVYPEMTRIFI